MKFGLAKGISVFVALASLACFSVAAKADTAPYSFNFKVDSSPQVAPKVVYTDGSDIYFILPNGVIPSGAFVGDAAHQHYVSVIQQPPYWVVPTLAKKVTVLTPNAPVVLKYEGNIPHPNLDEDLVMRDRDARQLQQSITSLRSVLAGMNKQEEAKNHLMVAKEQKMAKTVSQLEAEKAAAVEAARSRSVGSQMQASRSSMQAHGSSRFSLRGRGQSNGPKDGYIAAGQAPLPEALDTLLPKGWLWRIMAPLGSSTVVSWSSGSNWEAATAAWSQGHNWRLVCDQGQEVCVAEAVWAVRSGGTVERAVHDWAKRANWTLIWMPSSDWTLSAGADWYGTFRNAVTRFFNDLAAQNVPYHACFWDGNRTLIVRDGPCRTPHVDSRREVGNRKADGRPARGDLGD